MKATSQFLTTRPTLMVFLLAGMMLAATTHAQTPPSLIPPSSSPPVSSLLGPQELEELLAPIALYPDALIVLILPAATVPSDVVLGARFISAAGNVSLVETQPWDESVKSLARYPDVLAWMDTNLDWTASVGEAFVEQPADVMNAIQTLRAKARAAGHLVDTPQQKVIVEEGNIRIIPAEAEVIYVPQYDPEVVYVQSYTTLYVPVITFGVGFAAGPWLNCDFDWRRHCVYRGKWRGWNHGWNDGVRPGVPSHVDVVSIDAANVTRWQPSESGRRYAAQRQRNHTGNARFVGSNARPSQTALPAQNGGGANPAALSAGRNSSWNDQKNTLPRPSRFATAARGQSPSGQRSQTPTAPDRSNREGWIDSPEGSAGPSGDRRAGSPQSPPPKNDQAGRSGPTQPAPSSVRGADHKPSPPSPAPKSQGVAELPKNSPGFSKRPPTQAPAVGQPQVAPVVPRQSESKQEPQTKPRQQEARPPRQQSTQPHFQTAPASPQPAAGGQQRQWGAQQGSPSQLQAQPQQNRQAPPPASKGAGKGAWKRE